VFGIPNQGFSNGSWGDPHCNQSIQASGILGTPTIEYHLNNFPGSTTKTTSPHVLFVVAKTRLNAADIKQPASKFTIYKIDVETGDVVASKDFSSSAGPGLDAHHHLQRPGLIFVPHSGAPGAGYVYAAFASHCDAAFGANVHGWVVGFDGALNQQVANFDATGGGGGGAGIWQAGQAPVWQRDAKTDSDYLYVNTGNSPGQAKNSQSLLRLKLSPIGDLSVDAAFRPYNHAFLDACDGDLSAAGPMMLPDRRTLVTGGKQGVLYLLDTHAVASWSGPQAPGPGGTVQKDCENGGFGVFTPSYNVSDWDHTGDKTDVLQEFAITHDNVHRGHIHGSPVVGHGGDGKTRLYVWTENDPLKAFTLQGNGQFNTTPVASTALPMPQDGGVGPNNRMPGGILSLSRSAASSFPGDLIVWGAHPTKDDAFGPPNPVAGSLYAFDGDNVNVLVWSSDGSPKDLVGTYPKFTPPTISGGRVYMATFDGLLKVYGVGAKPANPPPPPPPNKAACEEACAADRNDFMSDVPEKGGPRPQQCVMLYKACIAGCEKNKGN
jgi:hypothetical protein